MQEKVLYVSVFVHHNINMYSEMLNVIEFPLSFSLNVDIRCYLIYLPHRLVCSHCTSQFFFLYNQGIVLSNFFN